MDWKNQRRSLQLFVVLVVLMVGALLVGIMSSAEAAEIRSGLLRADGSNNTHCSMVNYGPAATVTLEIRYGSDGNLCNDSTNTIDPGEARGVICSNPGAGTYCTVTSVTSSGNPPAFSTNNVRGIFSNRNANNEDQAGVELR